MTKAEQSKQNFLEKLHGKRIEQLFHTPMASGEEFLGKELGKVYRTVLELEGGERFEFSPELIREWTTDEQLIAVEPGHPEFRFGEEYKGEKVEDIRLDQFGELYFLLENGYILYRADMVGTQLFLKKYEEVFDQEGRYLDD